MRLLKTRQRLSDGCRMVFLLADSTANTNDGGCRTVKMVELVLLKMSVSNAGAWRTEKRVMQVAKIFSNLLFGSRRRPVVEYRGRIVRGEDGVEQVS